MTKAERRRKYYLENRDRIREQQREYSQRPDKNLRIKLRKAKVPSHIIEQEVQKFISFTSVKAVPAVSGISCVSGVLPPSKATGQVFAGNRPLASPSISNGVGG